MQSGEAAGHAAELLPRIQLQAEQHADEDQLVGHRQAPQKPPASFIFWLETSWQVPRETCGGLALGITKDLLHQSVACVRRHSPECLICSGHSGVCNVEYLSMEGVHCELSPVTQIVCLTIKNGGAQRLVNLQDQICQLSTKVADGRLNLLKGISNLLFECRLRATAAAKDAVQNTQDNTSNCYEKRASPWHDCVGHQASYWQYVSRNAKSEAGYLSARRILQCNEGPRPLVNGKAAGQNWAQLIGLLLQVGLLVDVDLVGDEIHIGKRHEGRIFLQLSSAIHRCEKI
mmetsp:Transcript_71014/g.169440  ORF Transcript_71014/g.169440 Transcript_71014/m.169440 type:complete len:288 (+) Transcript_71014:1574-2437(+)